jgi:peptide/nickel transport system substrate-binding protein
MAGLIKAPESAESSDETTTKRTKARRRFLKGLGMVGISGFLAGCGGQSGGGGGGGDGGGGDGGSGDGGGDGGDGGGTPRESGEVHSFEVIGNPPDAGLKYQVEARTAEVWQQELPFTIEHRPMDQERVVDKYFFEQNADIAFNSYSIRPERMDPHQLLFDQFHSSRTNCGAYNQTNYTDDAMDEILENGARAIDREERQQYIRQAQNELTSLDGEAEFGSEHVITHPGEPHIWNSDNWENITVVPGMGLQTIWSYNEATPTTDKTQMVIPMSSGAPNLTPLSSNQMNRETMKQVYDTLTKLGKDGQQPAPWLATDWEVSDDNLTITMNLVEGHTFHDGEPVTAEDVAFSYRYIGEHSPFLSGSVSSIEEVTAVDETTVEFTMSEPFAPIFTYTFNRIPILPQHIWENIPDDVDADEAWRYSPADNDDLIGSGHLQFTQWQKDDEIRLDSFDDHFNPPEADQVVLSVVTDPSAFNGGFTQGTFDLAFDVSRVDSPNLIELAEENDFLSTETVISVGSFPFAMYTTFAPTSFPEVRAAFCSTVPKQEAVEEIHGGLAEVGNCMISPVLPFWYSEEQTMWGMNYGGREKAIQVLEDRGFVIEDGTIYYPEGEVPESRYLEGHGCE